MAWTDPTLGGALDRTTGQPFTITIWKAILSNLLRLGGTTGLVPNASLASGIDGNKLAGGTVHDGAIADVGAGKVGWGYRSDYITVDNGLHGYKLIDGTVPDAKLISIQGGKVGAGINGANINNSSINSDKLVISAAQANGVNGVSLEGATWYNILSIALGPGSWMLIGTASVSANGHGDASAHLQFYGAGGYASAYLKSDTKQMTCIAFVGGSQTVYLQARGDTGGYWVEGASMHIGTIRYS